MCPFVCLFVSLCVCLFVSLFSLSLASRSSLRLRRHLAPAAMSAELKRLERKRKAAEAKGDIGAERKVLKDIARSHSARDEHQKAVGALKRALALGG